MGIGTAIAAGGTAFSALIVDRTTEAERPRVLSVVWGMRLLGVSLGSVLVNQVFGSTSVRLMPAAPRCWLVWSVCRW